MQNLDHILPLVKKPSRYIGGELHAVRKKWDDIALHFVLVFPDLYEIGMSHQGLQILYHIINMEDDLLAERCFTPDLDMEKQLKRYNQLLISLESRTPLNQFDIIGITLPYELCYTNILTVLDLAEIPLYSRDRSENHPLIIGGGSCSMNPEPVADFFDAIVLGDGEEVILELADTVKQAKLSATPRNVALKQLAQIQGVYVPSFFEPEYDGVSITAIRSLLEGYTSVRRRVLPRLADPEIFSQPLVPLVKPVHDRLGVEIARGCTRGCRFCQAGILYRPVRERSVDEIMELAKQGVKTGGFDELALLSLSTGDYSCLTDLLQQLMDYFVRRHVSVSLPSMRVGSLTADMMQQIKRVRKTGFTVAPEAGSQRLREVINKGISEEDLLATCRDAFSLGWKLIKFYFMIGLPTETREDVAAIIELAQKARQAGMQSSGRGRKPNINVSVATFIPKPHTPFQWEAQLDFDESLERIQSLKNDLPRRGFKLKWHDPRQSVMEGVFSRGDRQLAHLIETAWQDGVRFDGWSEHYRLDHWQKAAEKCDIDLNQYLRSRNPDEILPWDHLDTGVDREFLLAERDKAFQQAYTADCRNYGCHKCGLCDFKTIRPIVHKTAEKTNQIVKESPKESTESNRSISFPYRVYYSRRGTIRFLSHLEMLQLIFRAIQRAGLKIKFSHGFNPSPKVSFGSALGVGLESEVEFFDMKLEETLHSISEAITGLNTELPKGLKVHKIELYKKKKGKKPAKFLQQYEIALVQPLTDDQAALMNTFMASVSHTIVRKRKNKTQKIDIRPLVQEIQIQDLSKLNLSLISNPSKAGIRPIDILHFLLHLPEEEVLQARIKKIAVHTL